MERRQKQSAIREEKKAQEREDRRKQRRVEALEKEIEAAEDAIEALNSRFAEIDPADFSLAQSLKEEYDTIQQAVESLYEEWTALQEE